MDEKSRSQKDEDDEIKEDPEPQPRLELERLKQTLTIEIGKMAGAAASSKPNLVGIRLANQHPFRSPELPSLGSACSQTTEAEILLASSMSRKVGIRLANEGASSSPLCPATPVQRSPRGLKAKVKSAQKAVVSKMKKYSPKIKGCSRSSRNREREAAENDDLEWMLDRVVEERGGRQDTEASEEATGLGTSSGSELQQSLSEPTDVVMEEAQGSSTTPPRGRLSDRARRLGMLLGITPPCDDCGCQVRMPSEERDLTRDRIQRDRQRQINTFKRMMMNAQRHRELEVRRSETVSRPTSSGSVRSDDLTEMKSRDSAEIVDDDIVPMNQQITAEIHESSRAVGTEMTSQYNLAAASSSQIHIDTEPNRPAFKPDSRKPRRKLPIPPDDTPSRRMQVKRSMAAHQRMLNQLREISTVKNIQREKRDLLSEWRQLCQQVEALAKEPVQLVTLQDSYQDKRSNQELHAVRRRTKVASSQVAYRKQSTSYSRAAPRVRPKMTTAEYYAHLENKLTFGNSKSKQRLERRHSSYMERRICSPIFEHPAESCFPPFSSLPYGQSHGIKSSRTPEPRKLPSKRPTSRQMSALERRFRRVTM